VTTVKIGNQGEELACNYLRKLGYRILKRNFRIRGGEIDIVAKEGQILAFVEVKTRYSHNFGLPIESITPWKLLALQKTALFYIEKIGWGDKEYRFDVVSVDFTDGGQLKIEIYKNITA
jgi:putative endonuclease